MVKEGPRLERIAIGLARSTSDLMMESELTSVTVPSHPAAPPDIVHHFANRPTILSPQSLMRSMSVEQRWQDLASLLTIPPPPPEQYPHAAYHPAHAHPHHAHQQHPHNISAHGAAGGYPNYGHLPATADKHPDAYGAATPLDGAYKVESAHHPQQHEGLYYQVINEHVNRRLIFNDMYKVNLLYKPYNFINALSGHAHLRGQTSAPVYHDALDKNRSIGLLRDKRTREPPVGGHRGPWTLATSEESLVHCQPVRKNGAGGEMGNSDGFLQSILNDEDLQLMDMAMNEGRRVWMICTEVLTGYLCVEDMHRITYGISV
ncbi:hypothetical protein EVAR_22329_1 [Eumeta japonica]|uniref:Uncharacterized protein n=1 Tax=Eumeta variegata TaxID=151549 RepID=A0A4C1UAX3_EUMVA|nr:hypothetical protein EVAR_22329_1 [Eumeta japonica]